MDLALYEDIVDVAISIVDVDLLVALWRELSFFPGDFSSTMKLKINECMGRDFLRFVEDYDEALFVKIFSGCIYRNPEEEGWCDKELFYNKENDDVFLQYLRLGRKWRRHRYVRALQEHCDYFILGYEMWGRSLYYIIEYEELRDLEFFTKRCDPRILSGYIEEAGGDLHSIYLLQCALSKHDMFFLCLAEYGLFTEYCLFLLDKESNFKYITSALEYFSRRTCPESVTTEEKNTIVQKYYSLHKDSDWEIMDNIYKIDVNLFLELPYNHEFHHQLLRYLCDRNHITLVKELITKYGYNKDYDFFKEEKRALLEKLSDLSQLTI